MKKNFAIGIPTINRYDLLGPTLEKYAVDFKNTLIYIIDNGSQEIKEQHNTIISRQSKNLGVATSWNLLCKTIFENHHAALILNDDVYLGSTEDHINQYIAMQRYPIDKLPTLFLGKHQWESFLLPQYVFKRIGPFDEQYYPAYFEDNDYEYRIRGKIYAVPLPPVISIRKVEILTPAIAHRSMSMQKDTTLGSGFMKNREYYVRKWGGLPGKETHSYTHTISVI